MIRHLVSRYVHVSATSREAIREVLSHAAEKRADGRLPESFRRLPRDERRRMLRAILVEHADNRRLYADVMGGKV